MGFNPFIVELGKGDDEKIIEKREKDEQKKELKEIIIIVKG